MDTVAPPAPPRLAVAAAVAAGLLALVAAATRTALPLAGADDAAVRVAVTVPDPAQAPPDRLRLVDPLAAPDARVVAALGAPTAGVLDRMGAPAASQPDVDGTVHVWHPSAQAEVNVRGWDDGDRAVNGFYARSSPGEDGRLAVDGVVLGHTALRDAVADWGPGYQVAAHHGGDYAVAWDVCDGEVPVVVKLDVAGRDGRPVGDPLVDPIGAAPVTSVLVAYADEAPAACAAA